jgi:hypothetical protein
MRVKDSIVEQIAQQLEESELGDDANINVEEKGLLSLSKQVHILKQILPS